MRFFNEDFALTIRGIKRRTYGLVSQTIDNSKSQISNLQRCEVADFLIYMLYGPFFRCMLT